MLKEDFGEDSCCINCNPCMIKKYKAYSKLRQSVFESTCLHENRHAYNNFPGKKVGKVYGNDFILAGHAFALLHDSLNLTSTSCTAFTMVVQWAYASNFKI